MAVIQNPPFLLDLEATIERTVDSIDHAAREGAELAVFPEAFLPGYPTWIWRLRPKGDMALSGVIHERLRRNAVDVDGGALSPIAQAAAQHGMTVVCGMHDLVGRPLRVDCGLAWPQSGRPAYGTNRMSGILTTTSGRSGDRL
jgi:nitrilase